MILVIELADETQVITDIDEIKERRTEARTLIKPYKTGEDETIGEIELNSCQRVYLLPEGD